MKKTRLTIWFWYMGLILIGLLGIRECKAQVKHQWDVVEIVSMDGSSLKKWNTTSYTTFVDSLLIISCEDNKIVGLLSHPQQGFFDDSDYRVYKKMRKTTTLTDSLGTIYRQEYFSPFYKNMMVVLTDESQSFLMVHPNPQIGIVFHNKKK